MSEKQTLNNELMNGLHDMGERILKESKRYNPVDPATLHEYVESTPILKTGSFSVVTALEVGIKIGLAMEYLETTDQVFRMVKDGLIKDLTDPMEN